jgi:hypothetical protein
VQGARPAAGVGRDRGGGGHDRTSLFATPAAAGHLIALSSAPAPRRLREAGRVPVPDGAARGDRLGLRAFHERLPASGPRTRAA